jgi:hypothetical protein
MNFPSIDIQGSILSSDLLGKIRSEQAGHQQGKDFNLAFNNSKLKDEISLAWQEAKGQWNIFQSKLKRVDPDQTAATETRSFWILPLLSNLGYDFQYLKAAEEINGKQFRINNRDNNIEGFPLFIVGYNESLDKRPSNKSIPVSPHALVQEYLNYSENLYGLVTNGKQLRLLRDASRLTRLSYVEFNLQKIMEEDLYADFVLLYRLIHVSRMPQKQDEGSDSIIEKYHQEGLATGATIRSKLGDAVKNAIKDLANGFMNHPDNVQLRAAIANGIFDAEEYYKQQLRIIYRLLFLFVTEERNLVYEDKKDPETKRLSQLYFKYYSLFRLRKLAKSLPAPDAARHYDLWMSLVSTFALFEYPDIGSKIGIMSLQGDLFNDAAITANNYDLHKCRISNAIVLKVIKALSYFENDNKVLIAVNYGGLDVEEFGSVYEGLLELKLKIEPVEGTERYSCSFLGSTERSSSGSHYTPEELVQPLIKHSLDYIIEERLKRRDPYQALLGIKVCDVACGSGHILLSAARRIAHEVACLEETRESGSKEKVEQPSPYYMRRALREVIRHSIYGVDKNPLAVELCKVALWLESHNPGEPLNFLDHHIKCGDAIVGLAHKEELQNGIADEAFKSLPGDNKPIAQALLKRNKEERKALGQTTLFTEEVEDEVNATIEKFNLFAHLPERTTAEIKAKEKAYRKFENDVSHIRLKQLADVQVAQFFLPKTEATKDLVLTDGEYRSLLRQANKGLGPLQSHKVAYAQVQGARPNRFFHWFIEFPEVFTHGGFDCILGNPPFLGGQKLSGAFGNNYLEYLKFAYKPAGAVDLVTYFFRRIFNLLEKGGFQSLISTNTIAQGSAREGGLDVICAENGSINHAIRSMRWPGVAAVEVSLVTIYKGQWHKVFILDQKKVERITPYLDDSEVMGNPFPLKQNAGKSFQGSIVLGKGFILSPEEADALISKDPRNKDVLFPYLNGDDLNNDPEQKPSRWVINFFDWTEEKARTYPDCFEIVERLVKPERQRWKIDENGNEVPGIFALRKPLPQKWWIYGEKRPALYGAISKLDQVMAINRYTKHFALDFQSKDIVFSDSIVVLSLNSYFYFSMLSSSIHEVWAWKNSSTIGTGLRYTPSTCFETFPFPLINKSVNLIESGTLLDQSRKTLMSNNNIGLTTLYNMFHNNYLDSSNQEWESIRELRKLLCELDKNILEAYGWNDIDLKHDFYEVEYLSENDHIRFSINPDARKEILKRLLFLNRERFKNEQSINSMAKLKKKNRNEAQEPYNLFTTKD